jgi:ABC-type maltose transport system permease subunit
MAAIANQNGRHMVQYVLLPVNIHLHWNLFIFEFLTIYFDFILAAILKIFKNRAQLWVMIYFCVKFQKDPLYGVNLTFFAHWLPWQRPPFWIFSTPQKLPHTTVDIPTKFHEVWWKE